MPAREGGSECPRLGLEDRNVDVLAYFWGDGVGKGPGQVQGPTLNVAAGPWADSLTLRDLRSLICKVGMKTTSQSTRRSSMHWEPSYFGLAPDCQG